MNWISDRLILCVALKATLVLVGICGANVLAEPLQPARWHAPHFVEHPLVGSVWSGDAKRSDWAELSARIAQARYLLVGEVHSNVDHHRVQANVLHRIAAQGRAAHVVWEMIPEEKQSVLDAINAGNTDAARDLAKQLDWATSGWPAWSLYEPIAIAAVMHAMPMYGAALPRNFARLLMSSDGKNLSSSQKSRLSLKRPLSKAQSDSMLTSLHDGHCQLMNKSQLRPMIWVQRARDGAMARAMFLPAKTARARTGAVLIAGNEHIRKDWGVPSVLSQLDPSASILSIAQVEVSEGFDRPTDYREVSSVQQLFDFVVFTPRSEIRDHCAQLRKRWKR